ncbi:MAG: SUMF1/EgtB/PvdO family nonheme iron enzyme [Chloroflexi bacterium]|nr:SUMF1/EgtB/PvdO family nonheme iron enzyme [Chloroflexota bacterium]
MVCPRCSTELKTGARFCPKCGAGLPRWTGRLANGDVLIDRYVVVRPLARGGMGAVYLATDRRLGDAPVALKEMTGLHQPGDTDAWERAVGEFRREASLLARLSHPNLPRVIDQFRHDENEFLVMEYVEGQTLRSEMEGRTEPLALETVIDWMRQLTNVLQYLHNQNPPIIYRDLKPPNIMLRPDGRIALIDFGIARLFKHGQEGDTVIYGTPGYAPPEQYGFGQTDHRSDIYSLAMVIHELLTRFEPAKRESTRPPLAHNLRNTVPPALSEVLHRAMHPDPADRYQSMRDFQMAVDHSLNQNQVAALPDATVLHQATIAKPKAANWWWLALALVGIGLIGFLLARTFGVFAPEVQPTSVAQITPSLAEPTPIEATAVPIVIGPAPPGMLAIPGGTFVIGSDAGSPNEQPVGRGYLPTFYIDRTEVTVAAYRACVEQQRCSEPADRSSLTVADYYDNAQYAEYPMINVSWQQALTYCQAQNKRLPSEAEWERAARGTEGRIYPWGDQWDASLLNAWGAGVAGDTRAVGSYPNGATPEGVLDLAGNVWEWTSSLDLPYPYNAADGREVPTQPGSRIVRGSFSGTNPENARAAVRERRDPELPLNIIGFRCVTNDFYVPEGMDFIAGGRWTMGATAEDLAHYKEVYGWQGLQNEEPATPISTTAFYLDRTEVSNQAYAEFINATDRAVPTNSFDPVGLSLWLPDRTVPISLSQHPVVNVTWDDARSYCEWRGKRLPTEAEWERAARGDQRTIFPWGDQADASLLNNKDFGPGRTMPVGTLPNAGPYGTLDLAGNVWEWTQSLYIPYPYHPNDGRELPTGAGSRVLRGGSWFDDLMSAHTTGRNSFRPDLANINVGFRCAQDVAP